MRIRTMFLLIGLAWPGVSIAQVGEQGLLWRSGDPFVFCRYGLDQTPRAWFPVPNYATSIPMITPGYCPFPVPYCANAGTGWSPTEILAYFDYLRICPQAERSGEWRGQGDGTTAPFKH
ncbi:hypothetical protein ACF3M1_09555 [Luteimonas sp. WGS1318]|uniref:hypothetical protein n=1 Tax=Luteimonas sp. WGS1318 TaxID=3366815 RepID=UPI00372D7030